MTKSEWVNRSLFVFGHLLKYKIKHCCTRKHHEILSYYNNKHYGISDDLYDLFQQWA